MRGRWFVARWVAALVVGLLGVPALAPPVGAAAPISLVVTNALDNVNDANCTIGSCTLREAVNASNANDPGAGNHNTITFASGLTGPIMLTTASGGTLTLSRDVAIDGTGATIAVDGGHAVTVFLVPSGVTATIGTLTIQHGNGTTSFPYSPSALNAGGIGNFGTLTVTAVLLTQNAATVDGGAIVNVGTLTLRDSTLSSNSAGNAGGGMDAGGGVTSIERSAISGNSAGGSGGGAIRNNGPLTVTNSTIADNTSLFSGGIQAQSALTVTNSTIAGNTGGRGAGGINTLALSPSLTNTIVAGNTGGDLGGGAFNGSFNLIDDAATGTGFSDGANGNIIGHPAGLAASLANNGGPTQTIALLPGSRAIDAGTNAAITNPPFTGPPFTDQRGSGFPRIAGSTVDIGAFELPGTPTYVVRSLVDGTAAAGNCVQGNDANCRLRDAIAQNEANGGGHTITFAAGLTGPITLTVVNGGTLTLARDVTIDGTGATIAVDGNHAVGVFAVNNGVTATINALTVQHGNAAGGNGGGIDNSGTLTVTNSTFTANSASNGSGGGIFNTIGTLTVTNSTFVGNSGLGGGGIANITFGTLTVTNSTFTTNFGNNSGGGIDNSGTLTVTNSTLSGNSTNINGGLGGGILTNGSSTMVTNTLLAGNTASSGHGPDAFGAFTSHGGNLIGIVDAQTSGFNQPTDQTGTPASPLNPLLGTLGAYGSTNGTQTLPLLPGSPAIDKGIAAGAPATDQRGKSRVGAPDVGAFESQGFTLTITDGDNQSAIVGTTFANPLALTVAAVNPVEPVQGGMVTFIPPASGPSATLAGSPAPIGAGGQASATATANGVKGTYTVAASAIPTGAAGATFHLTNTAPLVSIAVTPIPVTLKIGQTQQFMATGTYADASTANLTNQVVWTSDAPTVVSVDAVGRGTGTSAGVAHLTAMQGSVSGQGSVTVSAPVLTGVQPAPAGRPSGANMGGIGGQAAPPPAPPGR